MRIRSIAAVLVLLVALAPTGSLVCALTCVQPPVTNSASSCHNAADADGATSAIRGSTHDCADTHATMPVALAKSGSMRAVVPAFAEVMFVEAVDITAVAAVIDGVPREHGPPGSTALRSACLTVLRI